MRSSSSRTLRPSSSRKASSRSGARSARDRRPASAKTTRTGRTTRIGKPIRVTTKKKRSGVGPKVASSGVSKASRSAKKESRRSTLRLKRSPLTPSKKQRKKAASPESLANTLPVSPTAKGGASPAASSSAETMKLLEKLMSPGGSTADGDAKTSTPRGRKTRAGVKDSDLVLTPDVEEGQGDKAATIRLPRIDLPPDQEAVAPGGVTAAEASSPAVGKRRSDDDFAILDNDIEDLVVKLEGKMAILEDLQEKLLSRGEPPAPSVEGESPNGDGTWV